ncbi:amino acid adenylation domain-containing protein [Corallococcus llansteffanensis]|uniref:Amino acid adenylation domain-containing protein n=1 Tax=Corallococcus llansteffanensis TaxID=2316731 RepID=A0A3A8QKG9_9BACT|nr:amino acid adenylation domain-containing protein [Corallococcus llansteffanensis]RKH69153.1 amino acid adenylation domain-containing protein [Corallococcus llansteffanensis]
MHQSWSGQCIHEIFEAQARRSPDAVAISLGSESYTYSQLNARANRIAHRLRAMGAGPEMLVGLCLERSLDLVCGLIGILKAGAAYVPLDPAYPDERLALLLEDSEASLIVTRSAFAVRLQRQPEQLLCLDQDGGLTGAPETDLPRGATPSNPAYVIYTSGSTGRPKGVLVEHRHVVRLFESSHSAFGFDHTDVWTLFHSFGFDFSVWEMWGALLYGGQLVVVPQEVARSPHAFYDLLADARVTVLSQTPSAFLQLSREEEGRRNDRPLSLRLIIFGGEALSPASLRGWMERHGDERPRLINGYGITETTVFVTFRPITRSDLEMQAPVGETPIGVPIADLTVQLLDERGTPVPRGTPGEIHVGGAGVARGYLRRPELNRQRFLESHGSRLYRSGDLAIQRDDGLWYLGRVDEQIKIRGFRIEPGEVENHLRRHPALADVAIVGHDFGAGDKRLVAYIVPGAGHGGCADTLTQELKQLSDRGLPEHMRPSMYIPLQAMPLNANGKMDRRALPPPAEAAQEASTNVPAATVEETLQQVWRKVLRNQTVGVDDDFFDMGGTSVAAINVLLYIRDELGHDLDMAVWAEGATVRHFAEFLAKQAATGQSAA